MVNGEFVKNTVMNEKFVQTSVMSAKMELQVAMDLPYSKLVDGTFYSPPKIYWKNLLMRTNRGC